MTEPEIPLRAIHRFGKFLDEVPAMWRPMPDQRWQLRFWAIDDDGQVRKLPQFPDVGVMDVLGENADFIEKDHVRDQVKYWCAQHRPAAIVMAMEAWSLPVTREQELEVRRAFGGRTPFLSDPDNRDKLLHKFGIRVMEHLVVTGEVRGSDERVSRFYEINSGELKLVGASDNPALPLENVVSSRFGNLLCPLEK